MNSGRRQINARGFQVFEAVARNLSMTGAAKELGITQSAVSHQLRALTERLGEDLIERQGRSIRLTEAGKRLARSLAAAFDLIEEQVTAFEGDRKVIRVGVYSSFAVSWLIPKLDHFMSAYADIDLRLVMLNDPHDISIRTADVFITSEPTPPDYSTRRLFPEQLVPVACVPGPGDFSTPVRLISAEADVALIGRAWEAFAGLNSLDLTEIRSGDWLCCSHYILAQEMALGGMGVALLPDFIAERGVGSGALQRLPGQPLPTGQFYALHVPTARRSEPAIAGFSAWLHSSNSHDAGGMR